MNDKRIPIDKDIAELFKDITQMKLKIDCFYQSICEDCYSSSSQFCNFREKLISNQSKLEKVEICLVTVDEEDDDDEDIVFEEHLEDEEVPAKIQSKRQSNQKLCPACGNYIASHQFKRHYERVHLQMKRYFCDYCSYATYSRNHIEIHIKSHLKIKTHLCQKCGVAFGSANILRMHRLTHTNVRNFFCEMPNCSLAFKTSYALRRHAKTHSNSEEKLRFQCQTCGVRFCDRWHLKRHEACHKIESHECPVCKKCYGTLDRLKAHLIYHKPARFNCEQCSKEFFKKVDYSSHLKTHSQEKDFFCPQLNCNASYYKNAHLKRHIEKVHNKSN